MNYAIFLSVINLILFSRLRLIFRDKRANRNDLLIMGGIPLLALPFLQFNFSWFVLAAYLLAYPFIMHTAERSEQNRNRNRWLIFIMHIVIVGFLCSPLFNLHANRLPAFAVSVVRRIFIPRTIIDFSDLLSAQIFLFGFLMVLNEVNIVLRYIFDAVGLKSLASENGEVSQGEYNTGRLIGLLERIFVFLFVLLNQYTAIGFILAAKGVARFQDFKSRTFAEYVLIGTLVSTLFAFLMGFLVKVMVGI